jgi:DNA-binding MarR family transcriptional regulator
MDLNRKIIYGLERLSDAIKTLLWEQAKAHGISPIQIQILLFVSNHRSELCNVTHLAQEFNVTKPTVSDAVRVLHQKGYLEKDNSSADSRSYSLFVTEAGKKLIDRISGYLQPLENILHEYDQPQLAPLFHSITDLIYQLNQQGILQVQRTCFGCQFYVKQPEHHYCNLLQTQLKATDIRLDCPEYEEKT